ncbi:uncharacterized protein LOC120341669 [Styela clava]
MKFMLSLSLVMIFGSSILLPDSCSAYPFHAQCKLQWSWAGTNCSGIHGALKRQANKWSSSDNCIQGGEKCLYKVVSDEGGQLKLTHSTPVKEYVDSITFTFCSSGIEDCANSLGATNDADRPKRSVTVIEKIRFIPTAENSCTVSGYSKSNVWYAFLDYGTNYCNMRNLAEGAGLVSLPNFKEETDDSICTMYSSADCEKY